jgi:acyl-homoserine lactone acylase PvdQ
VSSVPALPYHLRKGNGIIIRNGETDEYDWKGYMPYEHLPFSYNPEKGEVSSANDKTTGDDYPYFISNIYWVPYRITRIRQMLDCKEILGVEDFKAMVTDRHSCLAVLLTPRGRAPSEGLRIKSLTPLYKSDPLHLHLCCFSIWPFSFLLTACESHAQPLPSSAPAITSDG